MRTFSLESCHMTYPGFSLSFEVDASGIKVGGDFRLSLSHHPLVPLKSRRPKIQRSHFC